MEMMTAAAEFVLGILPTDVLPTIAADALEDGYDSESLRRLAGADPDDHDECRRLFFNTMRELDLAIPSTQAAGLLLARAIASDVVHGSLTPYQGAKRIWHGVYTRVPELKQLKIFVGLAGEYEDDDKHRDEYSAQILKECKGFLDDTASS
jgi:hypothetical protein